MPPTAALKRPILSEARRANGRFRKTAKRRTRDADVSSLHALPLGSNAVRYRATATDHVLILRFNSLCAGQIVVNNTPTQNASVFRDEAHPLLEPE